MFMNLIEILRVRLIFALYNLPFKASPCLGKVGGIIRATVQRLPLKFEPKRVKAVRHGEEIKTAKEIRQDQAEKNKTFQEVAEAYFEIKRAHLGRIYNGQKSL